MFRDFLYLHEVIIHKQINAAAIKNGIKAPNLSRIIKNMEHISGKKLFIRQPNGLIPTDAALKLDEQIARLEACFEETSTFFSANNHQEDILLYLPPNLHFGMLEKFSLENGCRVFLTAETQKADVIVGYEPIENSQMIVVKNTIGRQMTQTIWVASINRKKPLRLAEHLITELHQPL